MVAQLDREFLTLAPGRAFSRLMGYVLFEGRPLTTKGRWWNPAVNANLALAKHVPEQHIDRPIYIVGMGRSGTTLLGRILACHPLVGFLNEPKVMWSVIRPDEDIIGSYSPDRPGRLYLDDSDATPDVIHRARSLFSWYTLASRSRRIVDKYPELVFRPEFVRQIFPDARFLIAVRSPWSTLRSVAAWSGSNLHDGADWWGAQGRKWDILWSQGVVERASNSDIASLDLASESDDHVRAAVEWVVTMREAISLASNDHRSQVIRYDDLVRRPRELIRETIRFCELPASSRTENYAERIVAPRQSEGKQGVSSSRLPEALASAIDETWSRLDAIDRAP